MPEPQETKNEVVSLNEHWRKELDSMVPEWAALFPSPQHLMRFRRVVATAVGGNPALLQADRRSLWQACTQAAQDELMPDGREGALVIYNMKFKIKEKDGNRLVERDEWRKIVRWMPMVAGVLKRIRKSGELLDISVQAVHAQDQFKYQLGDDAKIIHVPNIEAEDRGELRFVYAIARTKDGGVYREVMARKQVDEVRAANKDGKNSFAWKDWYEEMARKSVIRRIAKFLPMGAEVEAIFRREEEDKSITVEAVPVLAGPRTNSRQARINGDWGKLTEEMDGLSSLDAIDDWEAKNEGRILGYPDAWQEQIKEYLDKRRETFWTAMASHKGDGEPEDG